MKIKILIGILFCTGQISAQKMSLCEALGGIEQQANEGFVKLKGEAKESSALIKAYHSNVEIAEAVKTEIVLLNSKTEFVVDYGQFTSESEALSKVEGLKSNLTACYPDVRFSEYSFDLLKSRRTNMIQQADIGFRYFMANFKIDKWGSNYTVTFRYPAPVEADFMEVGEPAFIDFYYIDKPAGSNQFSQDIQKIINKGKTGFTDIMGEEVESNHFLFQNFNSTFQFTGFNNCYIENRTMGILYYVIPVAKGVDETAIRTLSDGYLPELMVALGLDYAFNSSPDGMRIVFVNKAQPADETLIYLIEENEGLFDLNIYLRGYTQD